MWKTTYSRAHFHWKTFCCNFFQVEPHMVFHWPVYKGVRAIWVETFRSGVGCTLGLAKSCLALNIWVYFWGSFWMKKIFPEGMYHNVWGLGWSPGMLQNVIFDPFYLLSSKPLGILHVSCQIWIPEKILPILDMSHYSKIIFLSNFRKMCCSVRFRTYKYWSFMFCSFVAWFFYLI